MLAHVLLRCFVMLDPHATTRRCTVYHATGEPCAQALDLEFREPSETRRVPTIAGEIPLAEIMSRDVVCARSDLQIDAVVSLMVRNHVGCIPVVDSRRHPIGMVTKFDVIEELDAFMRSATNGSPMPSDLAARTADEIMMPIAITLDERATVAHAASLMAAEDMHHILVVSDRGQLVGVVSSMDISNWIVRNDNLVSRPAARVP